jgi:DNA polymerase type B, organellar and viral
MIVGELTIPEYIRKGIKPNDRGGRLDRVIIGGDTETVEGEPNTLQFYSEDIAMDSIFFVNNKTALKTFVKWMDSLKFRAEYVVYIHNLKFDLVELLYGSHKKLVEDHGDFSFSVGSWNCTGVYGTPTFARFTKAKCSTVTLIDSHSFFRSSLAEAAKLFCPDLPKLSRPRDLGKVRITSKDTSKIAYAMRDAEIDYHIGRSIEALHQEFDLKQCVSVADLAARIFRHRFLTYTIPQPDDNIIGMSLDAYHGGKNAMPVKPGWYMGVTGLDIKSAYPHAMSCMPSMENAKLYRRYKKTLNPRGVPDYGVYTVSGDVKDCRWPSLFDHDFSPFKKCSIGDINIQGFELNEAIRSGELQNFRVDGYYYDAEKDHGTPAMRAFVEDFYKRKETEKDPVKRYMYKTVMNSVYGKFIQTRKKSRQTYHNIDSEKSGESYDVVAGGMFHPFIAAAITAQPRAFMHRMEHKHKAIHTATDGLFTQSKGPFPKSTGKLGNFEKDSAGDLLLIRNKLYILYGKESAKTFPSHAFKGKHITKFAKHGFQGSVYDLERLIATNKRKYDAVHVNQLRESVNRGLQVNKFVKRPMVLKVGALEVVT